MVSSLNTSLSQQMYATAMKLQVENELSWLGDVGVKATFLHASQWKRSE